MKRIGLSLFVLVLIAVQPAFGQPVPLTQKTNAGGASIRQVQDTQPSPETRGFFDATQPGKITFSSPATTENRSNVASNIGFAKENTPTTIGAGVPTQSTSEVPTNEAPGAPTTLLPAVSVPTMPTPALTARQVAQNAVTQSHRLRLAPQVFEKNLIDKLGSRFVPIRNIAETSGTSRYRLPTREGTDIELVINQQHGVVSVTGSPQMVESSLKIVKLLDFEEAGSGTVARFLPVQQSNIDSTRRIADAISRESVRVAQAPPSTVPPAAPVAPGATPPIVGAQSVGLTPEDLTNAGVVGPVTIDVIADFNTLVIQGSPRDVAIIQGMIQQLEALSLENEPVIELIPMRNADSLRVYNYALNLYQQVYWNRRGPVVMLPLVKPNTILIIGRKESIEAAKELIIKLDTPVNPTAAFQVFYLKHVSAQDLLNSVQQLLSGQPRGGAVLAPQGLVIADYRLNALIVLANPRDLTEAAALIQQMDVSGGKPSVVVKSIRVKNMLASEMITILASPVNTALGTRAAMIEMIDPTGNRVLASVAYNINVVADARSNSIVVTAPQETMLMIEQLIQQLDQLPTAESKIRVFTLANGDAVALTTMLNNLFASTAAVGAATPATLRPGYEDGDSILVATRFVAENRTNSIIAIGSEGDLIVAEALLKRLDSENLENRRVFTMRLVNTPADELAPILNSYITTERQIDLQNQVNYLPFSPLEQYMKETNVVAEPTTNSLIITTTPRYYDQIRKIILDLDERPKMVAVDVLIAEVSINRTKDRGVEFGLQDSILFDRGVTTMFNGTNRPSFTGPSGSGNAVGTQGGITSLIPSTPTGGFSFSASSESVSMFVRALETRNKTQILARPRLVTLHNRRAQISVGQTIMYSGGSTMSGQNVVQNIEEKQVGTILDITPRVMPDGMIALAVYVERSSIADWETMGDRRLPVLNDTNASTTINAMDGQTVVFAGLITDEKTTTNNSVPGLNRIPIIKHLFEYDLKSYKRSELLIVMTPRIVRSPEQMAMMNRQEQERMHWCVRDVVNLTGDYSVQRRGDVWYTTEVPHTHGAPGNLNHTQFPTETKMPVHLPTPMFPVLETK
jgi:type II secretion system protein D